MDATPPQARSASSIGARLAAAVEDDERLDRIVSVVDRPSKLLTRGARRRRLLLGHQLGHALHPLLTDLPIGFWTSSFMLDLSPSPGSRRAAQRLVGLGTAAALPTAITGWAEWSRTTSPKVRRVGVAHAVANGLTIAIYTGSWLARRAGRHGSGVALGMLGALTATAGGFLGAHMAIGRKVGTTEVPPG